MFYRVVLAAAALSSTAYAQTFSDCDPSKGDVCAPDPAFGNCNKPQSFDFTTVSSGAGWLNDESFNSWWTPDDGVKYNTAGMSIDQSKGAVFNISTADQSPLITTKNYIFFGRVDVEVEIAAGQGIVTSIVLESDTRDEIDWEWIGGQTKQVQTNFFSKGVNELKNGKTHDITFDASAGIHTYSFDWQADKMEFYIDGTLLRTDYAKDSSNGAKWPQTPSQLKLGTWVGGKKDNAIGTIIWAGGLADFDDAPFLATYRKVTITDYCYGNSTAKEYTYNGSAATADSISVVAGDSSLTSGSSSSSSSSSSAAESSTSSSSGSTSSSSATATSSSGSAGTKTTLSATVSTTGNAVAGKGVSNSTISASGTGSKTGASSSSTATTVSGASVAMGFSPIAIGIAALSYFM